jgi:hypothetical protein
MTQFTVTKEELKVLVEEGMALSNTENQGRFDVIDVKLDGITHRLDKINGTVAEHAKIIAERALVVQRNDDDHKMLADIPGRVRSLEDDRLSRNSIKKWIIGTIAMTGTLIGIITWLIDILSK